jgi:CxxC motif-containing protein
MDVIRATSVKLPVNRYDVIIPNICGTGVDIVATKNVG